MNKNYSDELASLLRSNENIEYLLQWIYESNIILVDKAKITAKGKLNEFINQKLSTLTNAPENDIELIEFHNQINQLIYNDFISYFKNVKPNHSISIVPSPIKTESKPPIKFKIITEEEKRKLLNSKTGTTSKSDEVLELLSNPIILSMFVTLVDNTKAITKDTTVVNGKYSKEAAMRKVRDQGGRVEKIVTKDELNRIIKYMNTETDESEEEEIVVRKPPKKEQVKEEPQIEIKNQDFVTKSREIKARPEARGRKPITTERTQISTRTHGEEEKQTRNVITSNKKSVPKKTELSNNNEQHDLDELLLKFTAKNKQVNNTKPIPLEEVDDFEITNKVRDKTITKANGKVNNSVHYASDDEIDGIQVSDSEDEISGEQYEETTEEDVTIQEEDIVIENPDIDLNDSNFENIPTLKKEIERLVTLRDNYPSIASQIDERIKVITKAFGKIRKQAVSEIHSNKDNIQLIEDSSNGEVFDLEFDPKILIKQPNVSYTINKRVSSFFLTKYYLPRSKNNINRLNNKFAVNYNGMVHECIVPIGYYKDLQTIVSFISSELDFLTIDILEEGSENEDYITKVKIQMNDKSNFDLINNNNSIFPLLGFTQKYNNNYKNKFCYISDSSINLVMNDKVYLDIDKFASNLELQTNQEVTLTQPLKNNAISILIRSLIFSFKSSNGQPYDFPDKFKISFKVIYPNK